MKIEEEMEEEMDEGIEKEAANSKQMPDEEDGEVYDEFDEKTKILRAALSKMEMEEKMELEEVTISKQMPEEEDVQPLAMEMKIEEAAIHKQIQQDENYENKNLDIGHMKLEPQNKSAGHTTHSFGGGNMFNLKLNRVFIGRLVSFSRKQKWIAHQSEKRLNTPLTKKINIQCNPGIILREEKKIKDALESFQICYKLNNENTDNIKEVAKCLFLLRKYRLSLDAYLEAEKISQKPDWEIYHNIGQCLMSLGEEEKSEYYIKQAVQLGKQESSYSLLIKLLSNKGDLQAAITFCSSALEACPDSTNMLTESGLLHLKVGQTQKAFESLSRALALDSMCSQALLGIGCITQAHEEYDVALSKYKIAVQIDPNSVALWNNIGMCFFSKQKYIAAISCLKRALWLSPLNWKVLLNLGLVHLQTLQPASAFNFLCAAVNLRSDIGLTFMALGAALFELKDAENSLRAYKQATILSQDNLYAIVNTILVFTINGLHQDALKLLDHYKTLVKQGLEVDKQLLDLGVRLETFLSQKGNETDNKLEDNKHYNEIDGNVNEQTQDFTLSTDLEQENYNEVVDSNYVSDSEELDKKHLTLLGPDEV